MLAKLSELNRKYIQNNGFGAGKEAFVFTNRGSKLVLSAPHAVKTQLNGRVKAADLFTGALAELVGEDRGISTLIRTVYLEREYLADEFVKERGLSGYFFWICTVWSIMKNLNWQQVPGCWKPMPMPRHSKPLKNWEKAMGCEWCLIIRIIAESPE